MGTNSIRQAGAAGITVLGLLAGLAASPLTPPASSGTSLNYVECSFSPADGILSVTVNDEEGLVRRNGNEIEVLSPTGLIGGKAPRYERASCGAVPTVHNTDLIRYEIESVGDTWGRLSLAGGPLSPGRTAEPNGTAEIETVLTAHDIGDEARIEGTAGADIYRGGDYEAGHGINLNPVAEGTDADVDVRLAAIGRAIPHIITGKGADQVLLSGGPGFVGSLSIRRVSATLGQGADLYVAKLTRSNVSAGPGADRVVTGSKRAFVLGGRGDDVIRTGPQSDVVEAGAGSDRVHSGGGPDWIFAYDGRRDVIRCGGGRDSVSADRFDRLRSCERISP